MTAVRWVHEVEGRSGRTRLAAVSARTHYEVLGVTPDADREQIRAEYLARARRLHPDRLHGASDAAVDVANAEMALVNTAWDILSDPDRRRSYDASLRPPPRPVAHRLARTAGSWIGRLYGEYRTGKSGRTT